jgi:hypothetical protein
MRGMNLLRVTDRLLLSIQEVSDKVQAILDNTKQVKAYYQHDQAYEN